MNMTYLPPYRRWSPFDYGSPNAIDRQVNDISLDVKVSIQVFRRKVALLDHPVQIMITLHTYNSRIRMYAKCI